jgi:glutamine amidotransferase
MCRLFGFRSVIPSQVHRSLLKADNALGPISSEHPDGWGVAFYVDGSPHLTRSAETALGDQLFHRLSGVVSSETVLAHVRKATQGNVNVLNCHPFQYGRYTFAHNGDIPNFEAKRRAVLDAIMPRLRGFILGDTDSEAIFYLFLSQLSVYGPLTSRLGVEEVGAALKATQSVVRELCDEADARALLTMVVTDGTAMAAVQGGKELYFSTHKTRCADRDACPHLSEVCESPSASGNVNHFLVSSEPLEGENVWTPLGEGELVGVDFRMRLHREASDAPRKLAVLS